MAELKDIVIYVSISYIGMVVEHLVFKSIITPNSIGVKYSQTQNNAII